MKRARSVRWLRGVQRLRVRPGDVVVLATEDRISAEMHERLVAQMQKVLRGTPCIVLSGGLKIAVVSGLPPP